MTIEGTRGTARPRWHRIVHVARFVRDALYEGFRRRSHLSPGSRIGQ